MVLSKNSTFRIILGFFLLLLVLALPSGIPGWFDGLPWVGRSETLVTVILLPFLLVLGWKFLSFYRPTLFLAFLLALKVLVFAGAPAGGWIIKVEPNIPLEKLEKVTAGMCSYYGPRMPNWCGDNRHVLNKKGFEEGWLET